MGLGDALLDGELQLLRRLEDPCEHGSLMPNDRRIRIPQNVERAEGAGGDADEDEQRSEETKRDDARSETEDIQPSGVSAWRLATGRDEDTSDRGAEKAQAVRRRRENACRFSGGDSERAVTVVVIVSSSFQPRALKRGAGGTVTRTGRRNAEPVEVEA